MKQIGLRDYVKRCSRGRGSLTGMLMLSALLGLTAGCLSPRYQHASKKKTPPAVALNRDFPAAQLQNTLNTIVVPGGPGSWKKEAFWDEYIVTFHNSSEQALQVTSTDLIDFNGDPREPGTDPWKLERESKSLARQYRDAGLTVVRTAAPRVLVATAEPSVVAGAGAGVGGAGAAAIATASTVAVPVYGATILGINLHNRKAIAAEFNRRRVALPMVLNVGETRSGSLFFPVVPNPKSLIIHWSNEANGSSNPAVPAQEVALPLDFLQGLHVKDSSAKN